MADSSAGQDNREGLPSRFDLVADGYDSPSLRAFVNVANRMVELTGLGSGQTVVDACTGTGHAAIAAARAVGPTGRVIAVDASGQMCAKTREKALAMGLANIDVREGDAAVLPFADGSMDAVISSSAVYTLPDIPAVLGQWRRVLKPEGRLAFSTLGTAADSLYLDLLRKYGMALPPGLPFERVNTAEKCAGLVGEAGFVEIVTRTEQFGYYLGSAEECWDIIWNTGARIPLTYLPPQVVEQFKSEYLAAMAARATDRGIWIDWPAVFTVGVNASS
jgi:ubiquinone/menaquinone biosynthesis C-methylase UbiE